MPNCSSKVIFFYAALAAALAAQSSSHPELTARELFYNATAPVAPPAKAQAKKQPPKQVANKTATAAQKVEEAASNSGGSGSSSRPEVSHPTAPIITASDTVPQRASAPAPTNGTPLGMKYTVLKLEGNTMTPVAPHYVFHADDKVQFSIETNGPGYLYIVNQGSSGTWKPLFPSPETEGASNFVQGFHTDTFPKGYRFAFDHTTGVERLFIIFSRDAKADFEQLVYSLQKPKAAPASAPRQPVVAGPVLRASIDDAAVGRLYQTYARDLVVEKVGDDASHEDTQEKAVYVVNASGAADSAVVADLKLVHK